jgi:hypothetical protein
MKTDLLNDLMNEGDYADFRVELEKQFRAEVSRRKWKRHSVWLAIAASVALIAVISFPRRTEIATQATQMIVPPRAVVPTIITAKMNANDVLETSTAGVPVLATQPLIANVITTDHSRTLQSISDEELLKLFPEHATGLLAAQGGKRFVFLDPADAKRFMSSN